MVVTLSGLALMVSTALQGKVENGVVHGILSILLFNDSDTVVLCDSITKQVVSNISNVT